MRIIQGRDACLPDRQAVNAASLNIASRLLLSSEEWRAAGKKSPKFFHAFPNSSIHPVPLIVSPLPKEKAPRTIPRTQGKAPRAAPATRQARRGSKEVPPYGWRYTQAWT